MALCAVVATVTLTLGVIGSMPAAARRLATVHIPLPARPIAVLLTMTSLVVLLARPRPAAATVPPPIVRLSDGVRAVDGDANPPATEPVSPAPATQVGAAPPAGSLETEVRGPSCVVRTGDSLWRIAERTLADRDNGTVTSADIAQFWPVIYEANRALIGDDPNLILPGQTLEIPEV